MLGALLKRLATTAARAAVDRVAELITGQGRDTPTPGLRHRDAERIADAGRNAGRCPKCQTVHPSNQPCRTVP